MPSGVPWRLRAAKHLRSQGGHRMKVHANAPLGPKGRETMVVRVLEQGWSRTQAAAAAGVSERTCSKWIRRYLAEGAAGLLDRSSAPLSIPHRTAEELVEVIVLLRRL